MSLFICEECGCIENTACVDRGVDTNPLFPNMHMMDMQGHGVEIITKDFYKGEKEITMLCSACNTGSWHDEFDKRYATDDERAISLFSKYGMITPYDHPENALIKDDEAPHGYIPNPDFDGHCSARGITISGGNIVCNEHYNNTTKKVSDAMLMMGGVMASMGIDPFEAYRRNRRPVPLVGNRNFEKITQNEEDKNKMLQLAELKRQIKQLKRSGGDKSLLFDLEQKFKELK